jgi:hypothetical protein
MIGENPGSQLSCPRELAAAVLIAVAARGAHAMAG